MNERPPIAPDVYIDRLAPGEAVRPETERPEVKRPRPELDERRRQVEHPATGYPDPRGRRL